MSFSNCCLDNASVHSDGSRSSVVLMDNPHASPLVMPAAPPKLVREGGGKHGYRSPVCRSLAPELDLCSSDTSDTEIDDDEPYLDLDSWVGKKVKLSLPSRPIAVKSPRAPRVPKAPKEPKQPKAPKELKSRSTKWAFTINNPDLTDTQLLQTAFDSGIIKYMLYGKEVGENGTRHYQGFACFHSLKSLAQVKSLVHGSAHWEVCRGSIEQNIVYCSKDGDVTSFGYLLGAKY